MRIGISGHGFTAFRALEWGVSCEWFGMSAGVHRWITEGFAQVAPAWSTGFVLAPSEIPRYGKLASLVGRFFEEQPRGSLNSQL